MSARIKKNDEVVVVAGKDKGARGRVLKVLIDRDRVIVEGVNQVKRHQRPTQRHPQGGIIEKEMPVHISNVMLLNKSSEPVKVRKTVENGKRVRVEKKSGKAID
jgi:large subunit ribosomal protein L24